MNKIQFKSRKEATIFLAEKGIDTSNWSDLQWLKINTGQADIHMMFLAEAIYDAMNESTPKELKEGEYHLPYGDSFDKAKLQEIVGTKDNDINHEKMIDSIIKISIARCARLSYQTLGDNPVIDYEKDLELYEVLSKSGHWSPFEHVARVMNEEEYYSYINGKVNFNSSTIQEDIEENKLGWCRNFRGFIQQRALID